MIVDLLLIAVGLVLLVFGGDVLVKGAVNLSLRLGVAPVIVGLTVVAFGTSAPEMLVSLSAALSGSTDIALGNVIGSNIANVLVILGASALVSGIVTKGHDDLRESSYMMIGASVLLILLAFTGDINWIKGIILLIVLAAVLWRQIKTARANRPEPVEGAKPGATSKKIAFWLIAGLIALPAGAQMLVSGATDIARLMGISEAVIGLTLVAIGTSLPEMAASVASAIRGRADLALGNVIGSNIFNILAILGITSLVAPLPVPEQMLHFDLWVMLATSMMVIPFLLRGIPITRGIGAVFIAIYGVYVWILL